MTKLAENYPQGTANIADDRVLANVVVGDILIPKPEHANKFKKGTKYVVTQSDIDAGNPTICEYWMKSPNVC